MSPEHSRQVDLRIRLGRMTARKGSPAPPRSSSPSGSRIALSCTAASGLFIAGTPTFEPRDENPDGDGIADREGMA